MKVPMPLKDPNNYHFLPDVWVFVVAVAAGFVGFLRKAKKGMSFSYYLMQGVVRLTCSAVAGYLAYFLCLWLSIDQNLTIAIVAFSGHLGVELLDILEGKTIEAVENIDTDFNGKN